MDPHAPQLRFRWHPQLKSLLYARIAALLCMTLGTGMLFSGQPGMQAVGWWFALAPLLAMLDRDIEVLPASRSLRSRHTFLGVFPLWQREIPLDRYIAVTARRSSTQRQPSPVETETLALVRRSGRFHSVQYFQVPRDEVAPEPRAALARLSKATGLPVRACPDAWFTKNAPGVES